MSSKPRELRNLHKSPAPTRKNQDQTGKARQLYGRAIDDPYTSEDEDTPPPTEEELAYFKAQQEAIKRAEEEERIKEQLKLEEEQKQREIELKENPTGAATPKFKHITFNPLPDDYVDSSDSDYVPPEPEPDFQDLDDDLMIPSSTSKPKIGDKSPTTASELIAKSLEAEEEKERENKKEEDEEVKPTNFLQKALQSKKEELTSKSKSPELQQNSLENQDKDGEESGAGDVLFESKYADEYFERMLGTAKPADTLAVTPSFDDPEPAADTKSVLDAYETSMEANATSVSTPGLSRRQQREQEQLAKLAALENKKKEDVSAPTPELARKLSFKGRDFSHLENKNIGNKNDEEEQNDGMNNELKQMLLRRQESLKKDKPLVEEKTGHLGRGVIENVAEPTQEAENEESTEAGEPVPRGSGVSVVDSFVTDSPGPTPRGSLGTTVGSQESELNTSEITTAADYISAMVSTAELPDGNSQESNLIDNTQLQDSEMLNQYEGEESGEKKKKKKKKKKKHKKKGGEEDNGEDNFIENQENLDEPITDTALPETQAISEENSNPQIISYTPDPIAPKDSIELPPSNVTSDQENSEAAEKSKIEEKVDDGHIDSSEADSDQDTSPVAMKDENIALESQVLQTAVPEEVQVGTLSIDTISEPEPEPKSKEEKVEEPLLDPDFEIPSEVSVTTSEEERDPDEAVDTTMILVEMGRKRQKKIDREKRRKEREILIEEAKEKGQQIVHKKSKQELDKIERMRVEEEQRKAEELAKIEAEEAFKNMSIDEKLALARERAKMEKEKSNEDEENPEEKKPEEDGPVDSWKILMNMGPKKKTPEQLAAEEERRKEEEELEKEAMRRAQERIKQKDEDFKKKKEEEEAKRAKELDSDSGSASSEGEESDEEKKESTDEETLTEDQRLKRRLKKRQNSMKKEKQIATPKPVRSSAAGLQESIRKQLAAADEEEEWLEQEFQDLAQEARKRRDEAAAREVAEAERLKKLPAEERELIERAKRIDDGLEENQVDDLNDENDPTGMKRQLRKKPKKSNLKKVSNIGSKGLEGTGFSSMSVKEQRTNLSVKFDNAVKVASDDSEDNDDDENDRIQDDEDISDMEGSDYTDASDTEDEETEDEETDASDDYYSDSSNSEDEKERKDLTDEIFSSKLIESKKLVSAPGIPLHSESDARVVFKIRDPNAHAIAALRREFRDCPEVQISCGDYFTGDGTACDAMVIPMTNAFGFMDQPPELQYHQRFEKGNLQERLRATIVAEEDGELLVGDGVTLLAGNNIKALDTLNPEMNEGKIIRYVICVPIMRVPMFIQDTCNAYLVMRAIIRQIRRHNALGGGTLPPIASVSIPALCAGGFAMMPPARIAKQMKTAYEQWVLEKHQNLSLAQDLGELATAHVKMSTFKTGHKV